MPLSNTTLQPCFCKHPPCMQVLLTTRYIIENLVIPSSNSERPRLLMLLTPTKVFTFGSHSDNHKMQHYPPPIKQYSNNDVLKLFNIHAMKVIQNLVFNCTIDRFVWLVFYLYYKPWRQVGWIRRSSKVPSSPNHSMILRMYVFYTKVFHSTLPSQPFYHTLRVSFQQNVQFHTLKWSLTNSTWNTKSFCTQDYLGLLASVRETVC